MKQVIVWVCVTGMVLAAAACGNDRGSFGGFDPSIGGEDDPFALPDDDEMGDERDDIIDDTPDNMPDAMPDDPPVDPEPTVEPPEPEPMPDPIFGTEADLRMADEIWSEIADHQRDWRQPAEKSGWVQGAMPHGGFQQFYHNGEDNTEDGYIVIKRNYGAEDEGALGALTVMKRAHDFDSELNDWFFAKFLPDGSLDMNPAGVALAGRVGKGGDMGCVPCHGGAEGDDFLHSFDDGEVVSGPPFGRPMDLSMAETLWEEIGARGSWEAPEGKDGWVEGAMPHGAWQRFYHNGDDNSADGYIIVKENHGDQDPETLGALTVMKRVEGFDSELQDWFFAKFLPDGSLDMNPAGVALAGRVGKGGDMGCVPCHSTAAGGDFLHSFD